MVDAARGGQAGDRAERLRAVSRPPRIARPRQLASRRSARGSLQAFVSQERRLFRRWAAGRRGLCPGLVHAVEDVREGRHLHELPRPAFRTAGGAGQCGVHAVPQRGGTVGISDIEAGRLRRAIASSPRARHRRLAMRELPYAGAQLHDGGRAAGPFLPHPGPAAFARGRLAERLPFLPFREAGAMGGGCHRDVGAGAKTPCRRLRRGVRGSASRGPRSRHAGEPRDGRRRSQPDAARPRQRGCRDRRPGPIPRLPRGWRRCWRTTAIS